MISGLVSERIVHRLYKVGILLKGIDGILETIGGLLFLLLSRAAIHRTIIALTQHELMQDPDDWIANSVRHAFSHMSAGDRVFGGAYLLGHGLIKVFLVAGLWRDKLWAFPISLIFLGGFICYQSFRVSLHFSVTLVALTVIDLVVAFLIWREYTYVKRRRRAGG